MTVDMKDWYDILTRELQKRLEIEAMLAVLERELLNMILEYMKLYTEYETQQAKLNYLHSHTFEVYKHLTEGDTEIINKVLQTYEINRIVGGHEMEIKKIEKVIASHPHDILSTLRNRIKDLKIWVRE